MSKKGKKENAKVDVQEELQITPSEDVREELEMLTDEQEAIEAIKKYTDEDEDDLGEISVKSILGADFLTSKFMIKQILFVMFCAFLMILYTGNRYDSQQDAILIDSLRGRLQEVKYNVLTQSSELMNLTRQSNVEKMLRGTPDSLLHNSITPPYLIKRDDRGSAAQDDEVKEVLVGADAAKAEGEAAEEEEPQQPEGEADQKKEAAPQPENAKPQQEKAVTKPENAKTKSDTKKTPEQ